MGDFSQGVFIQKKHNSIREMKKEGGILYKILFGFFAKDRGGISYKINFVGIKFPKNIAGHIVQIAQK